MFVSVRKEEKKWTPPVLIKVPETSLETPLMSQGIISLQILKIGNIEKICLLRRAVQAWVERRQTIPLVFFSV